MVGFGIARQVAELQKALLVGWGFVIGGENRLIKMEMYNREPKGKDCVEWLQVG